jgi:exodeoxyribonuclease VII large subunit
VSPPRREPLTVSELTRQIIARLEDSFPSVWVQGEISDFARPSSGHWYFTLKDDQASLRAIMFRFRNMYIRFKPADGMQVLCRGQITGYAPRGQYQLRVEHIEPIGIGALAAEFERLKSKLASEGLFDPARKRPLPSPLKRLAVITSASGAVIHDMLRILRERGAGVEVLIVPSRVQGPGAAEELARAMAAVNRDAVARPDGRLPLQAVVLARGGGSLEDLWAFNEEVLARAIFASRLPVISAVGHEVDYTISDFTADLRAPTPTAAAELVAELSAEELRKIEGLESDLTAALDDRLADADRKLALLASRLRSPRDRVLHLMLRADELDARLRRAITVRLDRAGHRLDALEHPLRTLDPRHRYRLDTARLDHVRNRLSAAGRELILRRGLALDAANAQLRALSPTNTLERGYAIVRDPSGRVIRDSAETAPGRDLDIILSRGNLGVEVRKIVPPDK